MHSIFEDVCTQFSVELKEFNGEKDHVHLLINYHPQLSICKLVNSLKGVSSRVLKKKHPEIEKSHSRGALWSPSYFAGSCGGAPLSVVKSYIENQASPQ